MNTSTIYDRTLYKNEFKKLYNKTPYNFEINNNFLSNLISKWKQNTNKFNKNCIFENIYDYQNRLILREFRNIYIEVPDKKEPVLLDYIIWGNNENISRIRLSKILFLDGTFHHPQEYKQLLILMYRDIITDQNIPGIYILINGKYEKFYDIVLSSLVNILTQNRLYNINAEIIVTDSEKL